MLVGYRPPDTRRTLTVEGDRCVVHTWGSGPATALLLHGLLSDHRELGALPARLSQAGYTAHALDFRGCGASGGPRALQTLDRMLRDVGALAAETTAEPTLLVGHSLGAAVALHAAAAGLVRPQRVVAASPPDRVPGRLASASYALAGLPAVRSMILPLPRRYGLSIRRPEARAWAEEEDFKHRRLPLATWAAMRALETREAAARVRVPTLVLLATDDLIVPPPMTLRVAEALPQATVARLPGYHSVFLCEGADEAIARVLEFSPLPAPQG